MSLYVNRRNFQIHYFIVIPDYLKTARYQFVYDRVFEKNKRGNAANCGEIFSYSIKWSSVRARVEY